MRESLPIIISLLLLVLGISYATQADSWVRVAKEAIDRPERYFPMAVFLLILGLAIVAIHNVWVLGLPVAITIFGWILTIKGALYLVYPRLVRVFDRWPAQWLRRYIRVAGVVVAVLGLLLVLHYSRAI
jgi:uncharacterized protein YjeT (DUF2065 family)